MGLVYKIGKTNEQEQLMLDFQDGLSRTIGERIKFGFVPLKLPGIDDVAYRIFETMEGYREWCEEALLRYLGYWR